jgi:hypothetical protein
MAQFYELVRCSDLNAFQFAKHADDFGAARWRATGHLHHRVGVANDQPSLKERHKPLIALVEVPDPD